ncbi:MAG: universal stress protein [Dehalococcoidia bacterium]|nr:universal stress protein [Dehalococcoidia bacterium]
MKVLLAVDGSPYSEMCIQMLKALQPPAGTEVRVMTVVPEHTFLGGLTLHTLRPGGAARERLRKAEERHADELLREPGETLRASGFAAESRICWGKPARQIIEQAREMAADLVVIGAKGSGGSARFPLGSTAQKVMKYADTNVLLVRERLSAIRRVLIATDGSEYSDEVTRFVLDLQLSRRTEIFVVTALHSFANSTARRPLLELKIGQQTLARLQATEEKMAQSLIDKARYQVRQKGFGVSCIILRGEPAEEILMAADTFCPELIALGAKGLNGSQGFLMGSVAQRVARFARFSVLLGRVTPMSGQASQTTARRKNTARQEKRFRATQDEA